MDMTNKVLRKTISIDSSRSVPGNDKSGIVLLYDEKRGCYYETSIASISSAFIAELRRTEAEWREKYERLSEETTEKYRALEKELRDQQKQFISDTANATDKLIKLVEANKV